MPLVVIHNHPWSPVTRQAGSVGNEQVNRAYQQATCAYVRRVILKAEIPGIDKIEKVSVVVGSMRVVQTDGVVTVNVEHFLRAYGRTDEDREKLAKAIGAAIKEKMGERIQKVTTAVPWFSPDECYVTV